MFFVVAIFACKLCNCAVLGLFACVVLCSCELLCLVIADDKTLQCVVLRLQTFDE